MTKARDRKSHGIPKRKWRDRRSHVCRGITWKWLENRPLEGVQVAGVLSMEIKSRKTARRADQQGRPSSRTPALGTISGRSP